jgi:hypothetical protein
MFLCGDLHSDGEDYHVVGVEHLLERDPSLRDIPDMTGGFEAERAGIGSNWLSRELRDD